MKTSTLACLLLSLTVSLLPAAAPAPATPTPAAAADASVKHLTAPEAAKALADAAAAKSPDKAIEIIDVRTPEEFSAEHLKGARNIDIASPDFKKSLAKLDPAKTYLVHCAAGGRSTRSLSVLKQLGFKSILHLDGGLKSWKTAGLPLEKAEPAPVK
jgi:phage shock protein E